jgi:hypothetical protein
VLRLNHWIGITPTKKGKNLKTVQELVTNIYLDNDIHFDFVEDISGGDCDCNLHNVMNTIMNYWGE